jgi:hypothetical protein
VRKTAYLIPFSLKGWNVTALGNAQGYETSAAHPFFFFICSALKRRDGFCVENEVNGNPCERLARGAPSGLQRRKKTR